MRRIGNLLRLFADMWGPSGANWDQHQNDAKERWEIVGGKWVKIQCF